MSSESAPNVPVLWTAAPGLTTLVARVEEMLAGAALVLLHRPAGDPDDPFGGHWLSPDDVVSALCPTRRLHDPDLAGALVAEDPLELAARFGLDEVELGLVELALAPELEPRLGRVFAYLAGDARRTRPTVDVALRLLVGEGAARLRYLDRLGDGARLVRFGLITPVPAAPGLALLRPLVVTDGLVESVAGAREVVLPIAPPSGLGSGELAPIRRAWSSALRAGGPPRLALVGGDPAIRQRVAHELAAMAGRPLVAAAIDADGPDPEPARRTARRDALLAGAVQYTTDLGVVVGLPGPAIVGCDVPGPMPFAAVEVPALGRATRRRLWLAALGDSALAATAADRLPLDATGIERTAAIAIAGSRGRGTRLEFADLGRAARANAAPLLSRFATAVEPAAGWADLVLTPAVSRALHDLVRRVEQRGSVLESWGFAGRRRDRGVSALFAGPSGVGKSLTAEVIAGELGLPLWRVDLARVVSKYIGETEKHLDEVFAAAEGAAAMLLFDEADALFGKRSEVSDAHDRYANLEISYLLQRMETYDGVVILSTNLLRHLDEAFARRLTFTIHFPFPDAGLRSVLWAGSWPSEAELDADVEPALLAAHPLSGGNIGNAAIAAAHLARAEGTAIALRHVERAIAGELAKLGRVESPEEAAA